MTAQRHWLFGPEPESESQKRPTECLKLFPEEPGMTRASDYPSINTDDEDHSPTINLTLSLAPLGYDHANESNKKRRREGRGDRSNKKKVRPNPGRDFLMTDSIDHDHSVNLTLTLALPSVDESNNDGASSSISSKKVGPVMAGPNPAPAIPEALRQRIERITGGKNKARLIIQKRLFATDMKREENRLSMPVKQLAPDVEFLSEREETECGLKLLKKGNSRTRIKGVPATVIVEPTARDDAPIYYLVSLKLWEYYNSRSYVLCGSWNNLVADSGFLIGQILQVWFFRDVHGRPCFALVNLDKL